jgi:class 3 adenylate cyclase
MMSGSINAAAIAAWLADLDLQQYAPAFIEADIDTDVLPHLTDADLKELGVTSLGHRRKIMAACAPSVPEPQVEDPIGERLYLTVVFCDLVNSTRLAFEQGAERFSELLSDFYQGVEQAVAPYGGHIAQYHGDGVLVYFGYPDPLEDAAPRGVESACSIISSVTKLHTSDGEPLAVRIGVASGPVVVNDQHPELVVNSGRAYGVVVNLAARLQAEAETNSVVLSGTTAALLGDRFELHSLGLRILKGIEAPCRLYQVSDQKGSETSRRLPWMTSNGAFINHEQELRTLSEQWAKVQKEGFALTTVVGDHGIGKSRMISEFLRNHHLEKSAARRIVCQPQGSHIPFHTFRQILAKDHEAGQNHASEILRALDEIAISPQAERHQRRARIISDLVDHLTGLETKPRVLWFDDLHWADPSTLEVLRALALSEPTGLMLIVSARDTALDSQFSAVPNAISIVLVPLDDEHTHAIVQDFLGNIPGGERFIDALVQRAEGMPIFAEELSREIRAYLSETNLHDGSVEPDQAIPSSLQQSLQARIRRLKAARPLMRLAAVCGRESPVPLLRDLWSGPDRIETALNELVDSGLADLQIGVGSTQENCLIIRHQMLLDCAYDTILSRDRVNLHNDVVTALENRAKTGRDVEPSVMANQLERAQRPQEAATQWVQAGRNAALQSADAEAVALYRRALSLVPSIPKDQTDWAKQFEADTLLALYPAVIGAEGYRSADTSVMTRIRRLITQTGGEQRVFSSMFFRWIDILAHGDIDVGHDFALNLSDIADKEPTGLHQMLLHRMVGTTHMLRGEFKSALWHLERFVSNYDAETHADLMRPFGATDNHATVMSCFSAIRAITGTPAESEQAINAALHAAEQTGLAHTMCHTLTFGAALPSALRRDWDAVSNFRDRLHQVSSERDLAFWAIFDQMLTGFLQIADGARDPGFAKSEACFNTLRDNDFLFLFPTFRTARALAELETPEGPTEDLAALEQTLSLGERWVLGYFKQLRG